MAVAGVSYQFHGSAFAKLDIGHSRFGSAELRGESALRLATGLVF